MTKSIIKLSLLGLLAAAIVTLPAGAQTQATDAPALDKKAAKEAKPKKISALPFNGKLKEMDAAAKTISVGRRILHVTGETIITKGDKPATFADGVVGENVSGSCLKGEDGKITVVKLHFGPKPPKPEKAAKPATKPEKLKN